MTGTLKYLQKPGKHGFHIHQFGNLTGGCSASGGHFNPFNKSHGAPNDTERHVGDLGNVVADANNMTAVNIVDKQIQLKAGKRSIIGRALVVHLNEDDLGKGGQVDSKTTGHAGARIGCGIIKLTSDAATKSLSVISMLLLCLLILIN